MTEGSSKFAVLSRGIRDIALGLGGFALLIGASLWLVVHSPIPERASVTRSSGVILSGAVITLFVAITIVVVLALAGKLRPESFRTDRARTLYKASRAVALVTTLFCASLWLIGHTSLTPPALDASWAGTLLAAASLALFIFAILIALAAAIGWPELKRYVLRQVEKKIDPLRKELRGRSLSNTGYSLGELSLSKGTFQVERRELLDLAVDSCRLGYLQLEQASDGPRLMALNNWLYYMTFQEGPPQDPDILTHAQELYRVGVKNQAVRLQLTYCRVIARYPPSAVNEEWVRARAIVQLMCKKSPPYQTLSRYEVKEANFCRLIFDDPAYQPKEVYEGPPGEDR